MDIPDHILRGAPHPDSPFRRVSEWSDDPWALPEDRERRRVERHRRWIASITPRDWERIATAAAGVSRRTPMIPLNDLEASIRIGICPPEDVHLYNGQRFGTSRGLALVAWPKDRRDCG
jgi:hypothetical protein